MQTPTPTEPNHLLPLEAATPGLGAQLGTAVQQLVGDAEALALRGTQAIRQRGAQLQDTGIALVRERPLPALLIAAAAGATLMLLAGRLRRTRSTRGTP